MGATMLFRVRRLVRRLLYRSLHVIVPARLRRMVKPRLRGLERRFMAGDRIECPICGGHFRRLLSRHGHPNRQCPGCGSLARHRTMWLLLRDRLKIETSVRRVLHFAPEPGVAARIRATGVEFVTGDIDAALADERIDITEIPFPEASFDLVICSHVLEHVPNDRAAISEMRRVLRPGGLALIIVPVKIDRTKEFLDPSPKPRYADGYLRLGSHAHVREIGLDYPDRLRDGGLDVEIIDYAEELSEPERDRYAIEPGEIFYLCSRPAVAVVDR
jgi:SAM-dependent methyltransferase